ncbi:ACP [Mycobacterium tuberculosis]|nr:ACP [Mycobacterium tuberculosis]
MKEAINATIQRILRTDRGITANQVLVDDLGFDSLKLFQLITELEDEFDIAISFRDAQNIKTVGDVYTSVAVWFPRNRQAGPTWERNSMTDDADLDLVRRTFAAFARGDLAELTQCFAPDVEQFVPGKHALAGVFRGVDNVVACLGDTAAAADGTMTVTLEDVLSNTDGQVIAVYRLRASRAGKVLDQREAILVTVAGGRITRLSEFYADPAATESFWA